MRVFVLGGTGFVGTHVVDTLLEHDHDVELLVRPGSRDHLPERHAEACDILTGDAQDRDVVARGCDGSDAVINLIGIIREREPGLFERLHVEVTYNAVRGAQDANAAILQMSALGAQSQSNAYYASKFQGETLVKGAGQPYTIFRPSIIFGPEDDSINRIAAQAKDGFVPLLGGGGQRWQPIHVEDVAQVIVMSLEPEHELLRMGGPEIITYKEIVRMINPDAWTVPVPAWLMRPPTYAFKYRSWYPLGPEMLDMLTRDNIVEGENVDAKMDIELRSFKQYVHDEHRIAGTE